MNEPNENPGECECCGFETQELTLFDTMDTTLAGGGKIIKGSFWYCHLCSATMASTYDRFPDQSPSNTEIMKTICHVGNVILDVLKRGSK